MTPNLSRILRGAPGRLVAGCGAGSPRQAPRQVVGRTSSDRRGYTLVEVMVALTILLLGFIGLLNLQVKTINGASDSLALTQAITLAEHQLGALQVEALNWTTPGQTDTTLMPRLALNGFLVAPAPGGTTQWLRMWNSTDKDARVGVLGNQDIDDTVAGINLDAGARAELRPDVNRRFCVHYRLTWVQPDEAIRAEVRVAWSRDAQDFSKHMACPPEMVEDRAAVAQFTLPGLLTRNHSWEAF